MGLGLYTGLVMVSFEAPLTCKIIHPSFNVHPAAFTRSGDRGEADQQLAAMQITSWMKLLQPHVTAQSCADR